MFLSGQMYQLLLYQHQENVRPVTTSLGWTKQDYSSMPIAVDAFLTQCLICNVKLKQSRGPQQYKNGLTISFLTAFPFFSTGLATHLNPTLYLPFILNLSKLVRSLSLHMENSKSTSVSSHKSFQVGLGTMRELPPLIIPGGSPQCLNSLAPLGRCQCVYQEHTFTFWARFSHLEDFARTVACVAYSFCGRTSKGFSTCASCPSSLLPLSKKARHPMYYPRIRGKYT